MQGRLITERNDAITVLREELTISQASAERSNAQAVESQAQAKKGQATLQRKFDDFKETQKGLRTKMGHQLRASEDARDQFAREVRTAKAALEAAKKGKVKEDLKKAKIYYKDVQGARKGVEVKMEKQDQAHKEKVVELQKLIEAENERHQQKVDELQELIEAENEKKECKVR